jgi:hypothetical protein
MTQTYKPTLLSLLSMILGFLHHAFLYFTSKEVVSILGYHVRDGESVLVLDSHNILLVFTTLSYYPCPKDTLMLSVFVQYSVSIEIP